MPGDNTPPHKSPVNKDTNTSSQQLASQDPRTPYPIDFITYAASQPYPIMLYSEPSMTGPLTQYPSYFILKHGNQIFHIDTQNPLGGGEYGDVFSARTVYPYNDDGDGEYVCKAVHLRRHQTTLPLMKEQVLTNFYGGYALWPVFLPNDPKINLLIQKKQPGIPFSELIDTLKEKPFRQKLQLCINLADAVSQLHSGISDFFRTCQPVIHADLNEGNVLIDPENLTVKIIDFGLSIIMEPGKTIYPFPFKATPHYHPPEMLGYFVSPQTDIYHLSILFLELLMCDSANTTLPPAQNSTYAFLYRNIQASLIIPDEYRDYQNALAWILTRMHETYVFYRPSAYQVKEFFIGLMNKWFDPSLCRGDEKFFLIEYIRRYQQQNPVLHFKNWQATTEGHIGRLRLIQQLLHADLPIEVKQQHLTGIIEDVGPYLSILSALDYCHSFSILDNDSVIWEKAHDSSYTAALIQYRPDNNTQLMLLNLFTTALDNGEFNPTHIRYYNTLDHWYSLLHSLIYDNEVATYTKHFGINPCLNIAKHLCHLYRQGNSTVQLDQLGQHQILACHYLMTHDQLTLATVTALFEYSPERLSQLESLNQINDITLFKLALETDPTAAVQALADTKLSSLLTTYNQNRNHFIQSRSRRTIAALEEHLLNRVHQRLPDITILCAYQLHITPLSTTTTILKEDSFHQQLDNSLQQVLHEIFFKPHGLTLETTKALLPQLRPYILHLDTFGNLDIPFVFSHYIELIAQLCKDNALTDKAIEAVFNLDSDLFYQEGYYSGKYIKQKESDPQLTRDTGKSPFRRAYLETYVRYGKVNEHTLRQSHHTLFQHRLHKGNSQTALLNKGCSI